MSDTINLTYETDEGEEVTLILPAKMEVCSDCGGHGYTLVASLREGFTQEEFYETFDDEESREQYFTRGGIYDEQCNTCHGNNVTPFVDEGCLSDEQKAGYAIWQKHDEDRARADAEYRAEERMERLMGC